MATRLAHDLGGRTAAGSGHRVVADAPDGAELYRVPQAGPAEIDEAVGRAQQAFAGWRRTTHRERSAVLQAAAALLAADRGRLGRQLVRETGRVVDQAEQEVASAARILEDYARVDLADSDRLVARASDRVWGLESQEPLGVAALVTAWNVPLQLAAHKVGAALAAGCTAVLKPSPRAAASAHALADALATAGLPRGALSVLHGGAEAVHGLAAHPGVRVLSFTGATEAGRQVMAAAAPGLKRLVLELGGKNVNAVFADADLDRVVPGVVAGFTRNQGAVCTAGTRILVQRPVFEQVVERAGQAVKQIRVGDPYCSGPAFGALRGPDLAGAMDAAVGAARADPGLDCVGGQPVEVPGRTGQYRLPALIAAPGPAADPLAEVELFAPVGVIMPFDDEDEVVAAVNGGGHGLAAGLWSRDLERAERIWSRLDVGTVYVNSYHRIDAVPLASSGRRGSGFGSEGGRRGIEEFTAPRSVHIPRDRDGCL